MAPIAGLSGSSGWILMGAGGSILFFRIRFDMAVPLPKKSSLWPLVVIPFLMGGFYLAIAFPQFYDQPFFIWEHLIVLSVWIINTAALMLIIREILHRIHLHLVVIPTLLVPALSCYFLFYIYVLSILGHLFWDSAPNYKVIMPFIPHLFDTADNFDIPRPAIIAALLFPLLTFLVIFQGKSRAMLVWYWALKESYAQLDLPRRLLALLCFLALWLGPLCLIFSTDPSIERPGNFSHDPVVIFFNKDRSLFPMTQDRISWAQRDHKFDLTMRAHKPRVRNIFLFVVDALRGDHLPVYGYDRPVTPFFSKFLETAYPQKVDLALSNGMDTITGTQCLVTSKEPKDMSQFNYTFLDYLSDNGFKTTLIMAGGHSWQLEHKAFGKKIDLFYDGSEHPGPLGVCDDELVVDEVANLKPDDGGYHFFYIHLISVHQLSQLKDPYLLYKPVKNLINLVFNGGQDAEKLEAIRNMYDDKILQMDDVMKSVITSLGQKGYLKDYIAVFTADHGQLLGEKGHYSHGYYADLGGIRIPMVFFGSSPLPHLEQDRFGVQIDIAPTLTDMAGLGFPPIWQGQSLLRKRTNPWSYHCSIQTWQGREGAVVYDDPQKVLKYSRVLEGSEKDPGGLYDLEKDPKEMSNLVDQFSPKFLAQIRSRFNEHLSSY
jgi:glucan phosphoethanolaminetransferase (alkaline phosphatase superfamily)